MTGKITTRKRLNAKCEFVYENVYFIDGKEVGEKTYRQAFPKKPFAACGYQADWKKPMLCDALAVHPRQVKEAIADAAKKGVPTNFLPDGRAEFESRQQYNAYMKAYGYYNRDAGYGDTTRGQTRAKDLPKFEVNPNDYTDAGPFVNLLPRP
jgi:hypothetical protein